MTDSDGRIDLTPTEPFDPDDPTYQMYVEYFTGLEIGVYKPEGTE